MKKDQRTVAEYVQRISDEDLRFVTSRLVEQYGGDMPDVINFIGRHPDIDHVLGGCHSSDEFFTRVDLVREAAVREAKKRNLQVGVAL